MVEKITWLIPKEWSYAGTRIPRVWEKLCFVTQICDIDPQLVFAWNGGKPTRDCQGPGAELGDLFGSEIVVKFLLVVVNGFAVSPQEFRLNGQGVVDATLNIFAQYKIAGV